MRAAEVRERLAADPQRGLGCAAEIAVAAADDVEVLRALVEALEDGHAGVMARAANALKKVQRTNPRALEPFAGVLLRAAETCSVLEARWNVLLLLGRVHLSKRRKAQAVDVLFSALGARSPLERVHALDALAHLSVGDADLRERVRVVFERALEDPSAAMRARARALQRDLERLQRHDAAHKPQTPGSAGLREPFASTGVRRRSSRSSTLS